MVDKKEDLVEVTRSFSRKVNLGNYETIDIFCSIKEETFAKDIVKTSEKLFARCKDEVMKDVYSYKLDDLPKDKEEAMKGKELETVQVDIGNEKE